MAEARAAEKWHQLASSPIARALAISLMLHFLMIAGLELPSEGRILIAGRDVTGLSATQRDVSMARAIDRLA